jgi:hypothetical protein
MGRQPKHTDATRKLKAGRSSFGSAAALSRGYGVPHPFDNVWIEIGLPPVVYDWLMLNSLPFVGTLGNYIPLVKRVVRNKTYYVMRLRMRKLGQVTSWAPEADHAAILNGPKGCAAVQAWFNAIEPDIKTIYYLDDVVSLTPWCAKLVVAPEGEDCPWRRRKT